MEIPQSILTDGDGVVIGICPAHEIGMRSVKDPR